MQNLGKSINLFLLDGEPSGRIKCTMPNWTGLVYKIPRVDLDKSKDRTDLLQSGVYLLFGVSDNTGEGEVYIGQAGSRKNGSGILNRLLEHKRNPDKDYWTEAVGITTSNNSFGPTEISYLENRFTQMAKLANRYQVRNGNEPNQGNLTEEKVSEMEEFIAYSKVTLGALGYKVFESITEEETQLNEDQEQEILYLNRKNQKTGFVAEGYGKQTASGFVVLKNSKISPTDSDSLAEGIRQKRRNAKMSADGFLLEEMLFTSPSAAASFVIGSSANGLTGWKNNYGKTLKDLESES